VFVVVLPIGVPKVIDEDAAVLAILANAIVKKLPTEPRHELLE
jgi:hypothetical protein